MYLSIYLTKAAYSTLSGYTSTESWNHHLPPRLGSWPGPLFRHKIHVLARCLPVPVRRRWFNSLSGTIGGLARVIGVCSRYNPDSSRIFFSFLEIIGIYANLTSGLWDLKESNLKFFQTQTYWTIEQECLKELQMPDSQRYPSKIKKGLKSFVWYQYL